MKSAFYLTASLLLFAFSSQAQSSTDWLPFSPGQRTYWESEDTVRLYYCDSTEVVDGQTRQLFGAHYYYAEQDSLCFDRIIEDHPLPLELPKVDTLFVEDDLIFKKVNEQEIRFYHTAPRRFAWFIPTPDATNWDSLEIICTTVTAEEKTFALRAYRNRELVNDFGIQFRLHKNSGFSEFIPLEQLLRDTLRQYLRVGYHDGEEHGFISSTDDFFGVYQVGDVLKWRNRKSYSYGSQVTIRRDSILAIQSAQDTLTFLVQRSEAKEYYSSGPPDYIDVLDSTRYSSHETRHILYTKSYGKHLQRTPDWFHLELEYHPDVISYINVEPIITDSLGDFVFTYRSGSFYSGYQDTCETSVVDGCYSTTTLSSGRGLLFESYLCLGGYTERRLLGYANAIAAFGDTSQIVVSTKKTTRTQLDFEIFPNPTEDVLHLRLPVPLLKTTFQLTIFDVHGKSMLEKTASGANEQVHVAHLPKGIYFLKIETEKAIGTRRFVKY